MTTSKKHAQNLPDTILIDASETEGVKTLLGDPKKAIIRLGLPMIIGMSFQTLYTLADAIWVSGLGPGALSAVGYFFPFFMLAISLAGGIGIGGGSAVSRFIGAKNKQDVDSAALHTLIGMGLVTLVFTIPFVFLSRPLFHALGTGDTLDMTVSYAQVMFGGAIVLFFSNIAGALLRGEGDAKRPMYAMLAGAILNIILDPLFIYSFGFGVAGAAWASVVSMGVVSLILMYWLFFTSNTYISFSLNKFTFRKDIMYEILRVGLPSSMAQMSMSLMMFFVNMIITHVDGTDGVAVFVTGWRVVMISTLPIIGLSTALISVTAAAFGAKAMDKLEISFRYTVSLGLIIEFILSVITFFGAPYITRIFTWSSDSAVLAADITHFIRIMVFFYPAATLGILSSSFFQGVGKGAYALCVTFFRTILLTLPLTWLFGILFKGNLTGIWLGIVVGTWVAVVVGFIWANYHIKKLKKIYPSNTV